MSDEIPLKPDGCPPAEAVVVAENVYYFLASPSLKVGDVVPALVWKLPWQKRNSEFEGKHDLVIAWSHSVFDTAEVLHEARAHAPWVRKKSLAKITLTSDDGHTRVSPSPVGAVHFDWWCPLDAGEHDHGGYVIEEKSHAA